VRRRLLVISSLLLAITAAGWIAVNPGGRFGLSRYGLTTYSRIPLPILDVQIKADGAFRLVSKTHEIDAQRIAWLLQPKPEVLIVALGWTGAARTVGISSAAAGTRIIALPTDEALPLYNSLKKQGVRVAIHVHSTC
jgi:hypothetical protein